MNKDLNKLWAPWRDKYITYDIKHTKQCVFCKIVKEKKDKSNYIIVRKEFCFAVLNIYPYNNGHLLVMPNRHVPDLSDMSAEEKIELFGLLEEMKDLLKEVLEPAGFNIGLNLGRVAGAGFPGHLHFHIVPRWEGDVNFMPILSNTKVISQSLQKLHELLSDAYKRRNRKIRK